MADGGGSIAWVGSVTVTLAPEDGRRDKPDIRFDVFWILLVFALTSAPTLLATFAPPDGQDGFGTIMFVNDFAQYEAAMTEGARDTGWLVHDHLSPEAHEPVFMFPLYSAIGKLAAALALPAIVVYRVFELLGRLLVLLTIVRVARTLFPAAGRLAIVLGTLGGGLGVWAALLQAAVGVAEPYGGNGSYELNTYAALFAPPHVTIGMALTLAIVVILVQAEDHWSIGRAVQLGLATTALCLLHPFNVATLGIASIALALAPARPNPNAVRFGPRHLHSTLAMLVLGSLAAPFVLYNAATFTMDPFWGQAYGAQNVLPSPTPH